MPQFNTSTWYHYSFHDPHPVQITISKDNYYQNPEPMITKTTKHQTPWESK